MAPSFALLFVHCGVFGRRCNHFVDRQLAEPSEIHAVYTHTRAIPLCQHRYATHPIQRIVLDLLSCVHIDEIMAHTHTHTHTSLTRVEFAQSLCSITCTWSTITVDCIHSRTYTHACTPLRRRLIPARLDERDDRSGHVGRHRRSQLLARHVRDDLKVGANLRL
jgi:hypothetical protein